MILITLLVLFTCSFHHCAAITVCVRSLFGSQGSSNWEVNCTVFCDSISECNFSHDTSMMIVLETGHHYIMQPSTLEFKGALRTTIQGSQLGSRVSCTSSNTGLVFVSGNDVSMSNFVIENCSVNHFTQGDCISAAVFISAITNVQFFNITICHSLGSAICLTNIRGKTIVNNSRFWGNNRNLTLASSVVYIHYNIVACNTKVMNDTELLITNSRITGNSHSNTTSSLHNMIAVHVGLSVIIDGCASKISAVIEKSMFSGNLGKGVLVRFLNSTSHSHFTVCSSQFANNVHSQISHTVYHDDNHCTKGDDNIPRYTNDGGGISVLFDGNSSHNVFIIKKSTFINNTVSTFGGGALVTFLNSSHKNKVNILASNFSYNGQATVVNGGGLAIYMTNSSNQNNLMINKCEFIGNRALRGAGVYIQFQDIAKFNVLSVEKCKFLGNQSPESVKKSRITRSSGGGIEAGYHFLESHAPANNFVSIISCYFEQNFASFGGGTLLFSSYAFRSDINNSFHLSNSVWQNNTANFGAAVDLTSELSVHNHPPQGILPVPMFINCTFKMNKVVNIDGGTSIGKGTFISTDMSASFNGTTVFEHCNGSAIHMTSGFLIFGEQSKVTFSNNNGSLGGAIDLIGRSSMLIQDHSRFTFINNTAVLNGGAISYFTTDRHSFASFHNCFIEYVGQTKEVTKRGIEVLFEGNKANLGNSIYASTVEHCNRRLLGCKVDPSDLFACIANFTIPSDDEGSASYECATAGVNLKWNLSHSVPLRVIPGKVFHIPVEMIDEFNHNLPALYTLKLRGSSTSHIPRNYAILFNTTRTKLYGNPGEDVEVTVFNKDGLQERELKFNVLLLNCPPGYVIHVMDYGIPYNTCHCMDGYYVGIHCNLPAFEAKLLRGYWIGYDRGYTISENKLLSGHCPEGYCKQASKTEYLLPSNASRTKLDQIVCATGRTGILCGKCRDDYSVYYHGWIMRCLQNDKCTYGPILYILLELLPITIIFVIIILFDVPVTSGSANGFVLFCQVIDTLQVEANRFIWIPAPVYVLNTVSIRFIYKIFSLQFFTANDVESFKSLSFCLWKGATGLDMLAFHYVTLLYSLLLIILTVKVMDMCNVRKYCCECCFKMRRKQTVRGSITHGLTTFLLLCYSHFAQVSLMILIPATLYQKGSTIARQVVFYDGEVDFLSKRHLLYAIPALIVSVVLFILPLLLMIYPACYKLLSALGIGESKLVIVFCKVISIENLKPILDSFQGCFKDRFRFFAGLYFFYRLFAVITFAYSNNLSLFYLIVEVQLVLMLTVHAFVQPYKKRCHNILDTLLFADLALINAFTTFNFHRSFYNYNIGHDLGIVTSIQAFLICLPGVYIILYLIRYVLMELCGLKIKLKCCISKQRLQLLLSKFMHYKNRNVINDSAIELESFYYSYED